MADFKPDLPYTTAIELFAPTKYTIVKGVRQPEYPEQGTRLNCTFKTFGGTETTVNGVFSLIDTAVVETWYSPEIQANCRIKVLATGEMYEIIGSPENIAMRNQFCRFKVKAVKGGA